MFSFLSWIARIEWKSESSRFQPRKLIRVITYKNIYKSGDNELCNFFHVIIDFGFASTIEGHRGDGLHNSILGTPEFMAREIWNPPYYAKPCDVECCTHAH